MFSGNYLACLLWLALGSRVTRTVASILLHQPPHSALPRSLFEYNSFTTVVLLDKFQVRKARMAVLAASESAWREDHP